MKKIVFYMGNALLCSIFLGIRLTFSLFVKYKGYIPGTGKAWLDLMTFTLVILLIINICLARIETKK